MLRTLIIEDETILRDLLVRLISDQAMMEVVGTSGSGSEGISLFDDLNPSFVVLDLLLPDLHGIEVLRHIRKSKHQARVMVFSALESLGVVKRVMELGVDAYITKGSSLDELERGFDMIKGQRSYFSPGVVNAMGELMRNAGRSDSLDELTAREREIVKLVAESHSTKEIANKLGISPKTAETHRTNVMRKLGLHDVAGLTRYAIAHGLVQVRPEEL